MAHAPPALPFCRRDVRLSTPLAGYVLNSTSWVYRLPLRQRKALRWGWRTPKFSAFCLRRWVSVGLSGEDWFVFLLTPDQLGVKEKPRTGRGLAARRDPPKGARMGRKWGFDGYRPSFHSGGSSVADRVLPPKAAPYRPVFAANNKGISEQAQEALAALQANPLFKGYVWSVHFVYIPYLITRLGIRALLAHGVGLMVGYKYGNWLTMGAPFY